MTASNNLIILIHDKGSFIVQFVKKLQMMIIPKIRQRPTACVLSIGCSLTIMLYWTVAEATGESMLCILIMTVMIMTIRAKESVSVSINICPQQSPIQFGISVKVQPYDAIATSLTEPLFLYSPIISETYPFLLTIYRCSSESTNSLLPYLLSFQLVFHVGKKLIVLIIFLSFIKTVCITKRNAIYTFCLSRFFGFLRDFHHINLDCPLRFSDKSPNHDLIQQMTGLPLAQQPIPILKMTSFCQQAIMNVAISLIGVNIKDKQFIRLSFGCQGR